MSPRFSERIGAVQVEIQVGAMNAPLRNTIWNFVAELIPEYRSANYRRAFDAIAQDVLRVPTVNVSYSNPSRWLLELVQKMEWAEVYDLLEYAVAMSPYWRDTDVRDSVKLANKLLEREHSGYRFVNGQLSPITNLTEIGEIEQAAGRAATAGLDGVREQIAQAVRLLGQRPQPDYRNAVKEAISAVEGVVKLINGSRGGGL